MSYTKNHDPWLSTHELTARAFNQLESQYDEIKYDIDNHLHDDLYYNKTLSDETFFSLGFYTGFDADKLDGYHLSDILSTLLPVGSVLIWTGNDGNVPDGWHICNGGSGTVNLLDRFIIGAGDSFSLGDTGGPATWNGTFTPLGSVTVGDHAISVGEMAQHSHDFDDVEEVYAAATYAGSTGIPNLNSAFNGTTGYTGGGGTHTHTGSTIVFEPEDSRPSYYAVYYIQKVS
jgi:hypothetical protein